MAARQLKDFVTSGKVLLADDASAVRQGLRKNELVQGLDKLLAGGRASLWLILAEESIQSLFISLHAREFPC
jgi:hypothetical protein